MRPFRIQIGPIRSGQRTEFDAHLTKKFFIPKRGVNTRMLACNKLGQIHNAADTIATCSGEAKSRKNSDLTHPPWHDRYYSNGAMVLCICFD
jgi:hypothetical protein